MTANQELAGNVAIITGASKGIGAELARQLAAAGSRVVLAARDSVALTAVANDCCRHGADVEIVVTDVARESDCAKLVAQTLARFGRLDTLFNNAGATMWARFADISDFEMLARIMQVNYMGAVYCTGHALPHLMASKGRLVGIASLTALTGVPTRSGYAASKHAMRGFFDSLRIELEGTGVSTTMIYPGFVATGIRENATGPDGKPVSVSPVDPADVMSVEECARQIVVAVKRRARELVMTPRGKLAQWLKLFAPELVDGIARRAIERGR